MNSVSPGTRAKSVAMLREHLQKAREYVAKRQKDKIKDDMARLLTTMDRLASESDDPALLELVAAIMGSAPGLAAHLARRTILLDSVLSPDFYRLLPPVAEMTADLAGVLGRVDHEQDILDLARRWASVALLLK